MIGDPVSSRMNASTYLACDLGAESGRCILGTLGPDGTLTLEEIHRFGNGPTRVFDTLRWDLLRLFAEMKTGLQKTLIRAPELRSMSVDSWGVDYVYYNAREPMLALPFCYRDARNERASAAVIARLGSERIFAQTGIQFLPFNTLFQLSADLETTGGVSEQADGFLCIADYFNYLFGGSPRAEQSLASTTQLYNPRTHTWSAALVEAIGLEPRLLPEIVPAGTPIGTLGSAVATEAGAKSDTTIRVIATCSHDTGAAIAAVPAQTGAHDWAYLVSGTWSLLGMELEAPLIDERSRALNFTNEVGYGGSIRFLKNISGLWLLQEARRDYSRLGQDFAYPAIVEQAAAAEPSQAFIHPDAARFARPGAMLDKIAAYCRETGQAAPRTPGEYFRCIFESLALLYRQTLGEIEGLTGRTVHTLHIVGGGSQNRLLNEFTASATGRTVVVGPVEATAIGNVLVQAIAAGELGSLEALRATVRRSFPLETFLPRDAAAWQDAADRFSRLTVLT